MALIGKLYAEHRTEIEPAILSEKQLRIVRLLARKP